MSPTWSPDGQSIAFLSNRAEGWDLYTMPVDGGEATRLTRGATADDPAWSPDGNWIAIGRNHGIDLISPDASEHTIVIEDASDPTWSPIGDLAFTRNQDLYTLDFEGEPELQLPDAQQPHWSPDGKSIAFVRHGIWVLDLEVGRAFQRTENPADESPCICADGDILFIRNAQLMILHEDGTMSDLSHLPSPAGAPAVHPHELDTVAYHLHDGGNWDIVTASLERGDVKRLTRATWTSWNARL